MSSTVNPYRQVYDALWDMLERHKGWSGLVKPGNRVKYLDKVIPKLDEIASADLPTLIIIPVGSGPSLHHDSSAAVLVKRFSIFVATGDRSVGSLFDIEFQAFRAMADFRSIKSDLEWRGHAFCTHMNLTEISDSEIEDRGLLGWTSIWACEAHMNFPLTLLRED